MSTRLIRWTMGIGVLSLGLMMEPVISVEPAGTGPNISIGFEQQAAQAAPRHRVSRRTSRRTSRRVSRRTSIAGCSPYNAYYNCGGVYYRPVVESGVTVYVVVNP